MDYLKTFVISTSADPDNLFIINTVKPVVVLDELAGIGIISDSEEPLDGGSF